MANVHFYHNAANPLALVCELASKAYQGGRKAAIVCQDMPTAQQLDRLLWVADAGSFVPHVMIGSPLAQETPIVIGLPGETSWPHTDLLFNLAAELPAGCERFRMLIEIIGCDESERAPARMRWMHYKQQQFPLKAFDAERRQPL